MKKSLQIKPKDQCTRFLREHGIIPTAQRVDVVVRLRDTAKKMESKPKVFT